MLFFRRDHVSDLEGSSPNEQMKNPKPTPRNARWALLGLVSAVLLLWGGWNLESYGASRRRGIIYGQPPLIKHPISFWGINVALEQYDGPSLPGTLEMVTAGGFHWVRQTFPWAQIEPVPGQFHWEQWDRIVSTTQAKGLELVAVLDTTPPWAREGQNPYSPPQREADFGRFARAFALRYGDRIHCYQIWDEPNLSSHWGDRYVDPAAYTRLLRTGAFQIRGVDPQALILAAGLAPTWEQGPLNLDEAVFLEGLYKAGAGRFFDVVAAKPYGFWSGPEDRRVSSQVLNFSRLIRLREVMVAHGDGDRPIWAVEWGWNGLSLDWQGEPSPWGTDVEEKQIRRLQATAERARLEWPWLQAMLWAEYQPAAPTDDARWGFALLDQETQPRPFYYALQELTTAPAVAYPGRYPADHPTGHYEGDWRLVGGRADIGHPGDGLIREPDSLTIPFYGTELGLMVRRGDYWAWLEVTVDGEPANALPKDEEGRSYVILYDPRWREATVSLTKGLTEGFHRVRIVPHGGWGQWAIQGWVVSREAPPWPRRLAVISGAAGLALLSWAVWRARGTVCRVKRYSRRVAPWTATRLCLPFAVLSGVWFSLPWGKEVVLASTTAFALIATWQPLWALGALLFALPFYMSSHPLPGLSVAALDLMGAAAIVGMFGRWLTGLWESRGKLRIVGGRLPSCGGTFAALAVLSLISTLAAEERALAWAAFWRVIVLPGLFYLLVWTLPQGRRGVGEVIKVWMVASVTAAVMGIYQLASGQTIPVEGVRRVAGAYSSPNHLALYLERMVPLLVAIVLSGQFLQRGGRHSQRWGYGLALVPILAALYLTYSRAAWLLALPISLLFLGLAGKGRWRRWLWVGVLLAVGTIVPWWRTERLASLFDLGRGTGALRLQVWRGTLEMIAAHPLLGIGPGNFQYIYPRYMRPTAWTEPLLYHSHNVFLDFAVFLGLGGLGLFIGLLVVFFRTGWRLLRTLPLSVQSEAHPTPPGPPYWGGMGGWGGERILLLGLMAGAVGSLAHGLVDNGYFLPDLACLWALMLGLVDWLACDLGSGCDA